MMADTASAIPAAAAVLMRRGDAGPELLMVERSRALAFAPGALTFPGGRVDPADQAMAATLVSPPADAAARIAAIRETIEEVGILPGADLPADQIAALRARLSAGEGLDAVPPFRALVPFARWRPAGGVSRIFDTRFYLAEQALTAPPARVDGTENVRLLWTTARDALAAADRGEAMLLFPTRRLLERLATFASFADAAADARRRPDMVVTPWTEPRGGVLHLCIPDGLGYPVTSEPLAQVHRG